MSHLTIDWRAGIPTEVLRRTRSGVEAWGTLRPKMWWHALGLVGLLGRRCQSRAALSCTPGHYASKEVAGAMANLWRLRLGRSTVVLRVLAGATARFQFALELRNPFFIPAMVSFELHRNRGIARKQPVKMVENLLCLHRVVLRLERVDFGANQLNLLYVTRDCQWKEC